MVVGIKSRDQGLGNTGTGREIMSIDPEQVREVVVFWS